jgi:hypothetical protein
MALYCAAGIPITIYVLLREHLSQSTSITQIILGWNAEYHRNLLVRGLGTIFALVGLSYGGYIAASRAKHDELLNATLSSLFCILEPFLFFAENRALPAPWEGIPMILAPIAALVGGYIRLRKRRPVRPVAG